MANIDEKRRKCILQEWIDELKTGRGIIENDALDKTGLVPVRREILDRLEQLIAYAESKMPGFDPMADVVSEAPIEAAESLQTAMAGNRRRSDYRRGTAPAHGSLRIDNSKIWVHRRKSDSESD